VPRPLGGDDAFSGSDVDHRSYAKLSVLRRLASILDVGWGLHPLTLFRPSHLRPVFLCFVFVL